MLSSGSELFSVCANAKVSSDDFLNPFFALVVTVPEFGFIIASCGKWLIAAELSFLLFLCHR